MMGLSQDEIRRYNRHLIMPEVGQAGQEKLKAARVLVIGAGGLGCPVLQYLVAAGVGRITVLDDDIVDESNLQRQILFDVDDIGRPKAQVAKEKLERQNPLCSIDAVKERFTSANARQLVAAHDLVIDGSDNFPTRYLSNDATCLEKTPLVFGSIFKFQGQVSVFNLNDGPTYRCLFPEPPGPGEVPNCAEIGVLGVLPGLIGTMMANEAIKIILGVGEVLSGKLLTLDALTMHSTTLSFDRSDVQIKELIDYEEFCGLGGDDEMTVSELKEWMDTGVEFQLIDVREPAEYELGNLGGKLIPLGTVAAHVDEIDRVGKVVVHCKRGGRSARAIEYLKVEHGYDNLINLKGGILEWKKQIDPTVKA